MRANTLFSEWGEKAAKNVARRCYIEKLYKVASWKFICIKIIIFKGVKNISLKILKSYANFIENPFENELKYAHLNREGMIKIDEYF